MIEGLPREWMRGPQWPGDEVRARWEPVVRAAAAAWNELELISVSEGLRPSALVYLSPEDLVRATADTAAAGLQVTPLVFADGQFRAAVHASRGGSLRRSWLTAWANGDDVAIGDLLGFPRCCAQAFQENWVARRRTDTVLTQRRVDGPPEANIMLRQLGVRLVPHLPCSADCEATVELGRSMLALGRLALGADAEALVELLSLPVEYDAVHGVARVETPHFRFFVGTDYTAERVRAARDAAAAEVQTTVASPRTARVVDVGAALAAEQSAKDNGFSSVAAMDAAHEIVLAVAFHGDANPMSGYDLGCGDGTLLAKAWLRAGGDGLWGGRDVDRDRVQSGRARYPQLDLIVAKIETWFAAPRDVTFLMPGRLLEMTAAAAEHVRRELRACRRVVVYNYDGQSLGTLCELAGLPSPTPETHQVHGQVSAAVLGPWPYQPDETGRPA